MIIIPCAIGCYQNEHQLRMVLIEMYRSFESLNSIDPHENFKILYIFRLVVVMLYSLVGCLVHGNCSVSYSNRSFDPGFHASRSRGRDQILHCAKYE